jgi:hypothetical protein
MSPKITRRPIANARSGLNRYLWKVKTGMACDASAYGSTGRVNCEALTRAAGQKLKQLLKKQGWGRRSWPTEAVFCCLLVITRLFSKYLYFTSPVNSNYSLCKKKCNFTLLMSLMRALFNKLVTCDYGEASTSTYDERYSRTAFPGQNPLRNLVVAGSNFPNAAVAVSEKDLE